MIVREGRKKRESSEKKEKKIVENSFSIFKKPYDFSKGKT